MALGFAISGYSRTFGIGDEEKAQKTVAKNLENEKKNIVIYVHNKDKEIYFVNLDIAVSLKTRLVKSGFRVKISDTTNPSDAILNINLYGTKVDNPFKSGVSAKYDNGNAVSKKLANNIVNSVANNTGFNNNGIKKSSNDQAVPTCTVYTGTFSNTKQLKKLKTQKYKSKIAKGISLGVKAFLKDKTVEKKAKKKVNKKTMYLTFDDGPIPGHTDKILDILKEKNIKATFFVVGSQVKKHPALTRRIVKEGHTIGIHCYDHTYTNIYSSVSAYWNDFIRAQKLVKKVTGVKVKLFRFPGGSKNSFNRYTYKAIRNKMLSNGCYYFDWNAMFGDAGEEKTVKGVLNFVANNTPTDKNIVMLAHDAGARGSTSKALKRIVNGLSEYFNFKPITRKTKAIRF